MRPSWVELISTIIKKLPRPPLSFCALHATLRHAKKNVLQTKESFNAFSRPFRKGQPTKLLRTFETLQNAKDGVLYKTFPLFLTQPTSLYVSYISPNWTNVWPMFVFPTKRRRKPFPLTSRLKWRAKAQKPTGAQKHQQKQKWGLKVCLPALRPFFPFYCVKKAPLRTTKVFCPSVSRTSKRGHRRFFLLLHPPFWRLHFHSPPFPRLSFTKMAFPPFHPPSFLRFFEAFARVEERGQKGIYWHPMLAGLTAAGFFCPLPPPFGGRGKGTYSIKKRGSFWPKAKKKGGGGCCNQNLGKTAFCCSRVRKRCRSKSIPYVGNFPLPSFWAAVPTK